MESQSVNQDYSPGTAGYRLSSLIGLVRKITRSASVCLRLSGESFICSDESEEWNKTSGA